MTFARARNRPGGRRSLTRRHRLFLRLAGGKKADGSKQCNSGDDGSFHRLVVNKFEIVRSQRKAQAILASAKPSPVSLQRAPAD